MKYTNRADLLIAAGESIKMQEKAGCIPKCKHEQDVFEIMDCRFSASDAHKYEFPLAVVEGKPVFVGDELYDEYGRKQIAEWCKGGVLYASGLGYTLGTWSWKPPKPKTVMVELLVEDAEYLKEHFVSCTNIHISASKALENLK